MYRIAAAAALAILAVDTHAQTRTRSVGNVSAVATTLADIGQNIRPPFDHQSPTNPVGQGLDPVTFAIPQSLSELWLSGAASPYTASTTAASQDGAAAGIMEHASFASLSRGVLAAYRGQALSLGDAASGNASGSTVIATAQSALTVVDTFGCRPPGTPVIVRYTVCVRSVATVSSLGVRSSGRDEARVTWTSNSNGNVLLGSKLMDGQDGLIQGDPQPTAEYHYAINTTVGGPAFGDFMEVQVNALARTDGETLPKPGDLSTCELIVAVEWESASITDTAGNPLRCLSLLNQAGDVIIAGEDPGCYADCNADDTLNVDDIDCFVAAFLAGNLAMADCNADTTLNVDDIDCFVAGFLTGCP